MLKKLQFLILKTVRSYWSQ